MPLSPRILRGLNIGGWKTYEPRIREEDLQEYEPAEENEIEEEEQLPPPPTREEIEMERAQILAEARKEGEGLRRETLLEAEEEANELRKMAEQDGYKDGFSRGEQEAQQLKEEARRIMETAKEEHRVLLNRAEAEILQIAVAIAEKLLAVQVEINEDAMLAIIVRCVEALPGAREVVLHVNPKDEPLCRRKVQVLQALLRKDVSLQIVADDEIGESSCVVESEEAEVSFHMRKELELLTKKLLQIAEASGD